MKHEFSGLLHAAAERSVDPVAIPIMYPPVQKTLTPSTVSAEATHPPAILMLHGFTGNPGELKYAAQRISEAGYTVSVPRLPGHGTGGADFEYTGANDWIRRSVDAYLDLRAQSASVSLVGLSMGALIAVLMASSIEIQALVMCAPALEVNQRFLPFTPILGKLVKSYTGSYNPEKITPEFRELAQQYRSRRWVRAAGELYRLQRAARIALPHILCPSTTLLADSDPTVPISVQTRISNSLARPDHELRVFETNDHVILNGSAREQVLDYLIERLDFHHGHRSEA
ncbi:MAG: alpha/beta fold hydrolase [Spirochaetaceae bacterium]|nr:MAG: alpha/beta fold hydrolase [Spirochaetaceae bacterium]